jgi:polysaccharide export outer membrane protein
MNYDSPAASRTQSASSENSTRKSSDGRESDAISQGGRSFERPAPGSVNGDYILCIGDTLELVVYREPDLGMRSKIGNDGMVQLPFLGEIKLAGLAVRDAASLIRQKYDADYLVNPQIYLDVVSYHPRKFTIIGQVNRPGTYDFGGSNSLGILEAIGMAGGFTRIADRGHVIIKRRDGNGNGITTLKVNAKNLADAGVDHFEIQTGDIINVGESWY